MTEQAKTSGFRAWIIAARPHTLPAAIAPVLVGMGLAAHREMFAPLPAVCALLGAILIQIGTNFANDYFDARKGVDAEREAGFTRVTQTGLLSPEEVLGGMVFFYGTAVVVGVYLVVTGGLPILLVGLFGILAGVLYSGGPLPYGSYGLGDLMVFLFFGVIAVTGTYYVQAAYHMAPSFVPEDFGGLLPIEAVMASLPAAGLSTNILIVNNLRDLETDRKAGKWTMAVLLGPVLSKFEFGLCLCLAFGVPVWFVLKPGFGPVVLLPLLSLPLGSYLQYRLSESPGGTEMNQILTRTGQLLFLHSLLFALGLFLS